MNTWYNRDSLFKKRAKTSICIFPSHYKYKNPLLILNTPSLLGFLNFDRKREKMNGSASAMELDQPQEEEDRFLAFVDYARSVLSLEAEEEDRDQDPNGNGSQTSGPGWSWIAIRILKTCVAYSSGVTTAILLSDLSQVSLLFEPRLVAEKMCGKINCHLRSLFTKSVFGLLVCSFWLYCT